jgi:CRISPR type I-E-associated protein CasB/Cse2
MGEMETAEVQFINYLECLRETQNRGALAALRRSLTRRPGEDPRAYPNVIPMLPKDPPRWVEKCYFIVAGLFGLWVQGEPRRDEHKAATSENFGASLARFAVAETASDSIGRRFIALLDSDANDVHVHLRQLVSILKGNSSGVQINWLQLLKDLRWWNCPDRRVQINWARAYYKKLSPRREFIESNEEMGVSKKGEKL